MLTKCFAKQNYSDRVANYDEDIEDHQKKTSRDTYQSVL